MTLTLVPPPPACIHDKMSVTVTAVRFDDWAPGRAIGHIDVTVTCEACGEPMHVPGLPVGISMTAPTASPTGEETRLPIWAGRSEFGRALDQMRVDNQRATIGGVDAAVPLREAQEARMLKLQEVIEAARAHVDDDLYVGIYVPTRRGAPPGIEMAQAMIRYDRDGGWVVVKNRYGPIDQ